MHPCALFASPFLPPPCGQPPYLQMLSGPRSDSITVPVTLWFQSLYVVLWLSCISSVRLSYVLSPLNIALRNPKLLSHSLDEVSDFGTLFKPLDSSLIDRHVH